MSGMNSHLTWARLEDEPSWRVGLLDRCPPEDISEECARGFRVIRVDEEMDSCEQRVRSYSRSSVSRWRYDTGRELRPTSASGTPVRLVSASFELATHDELVTLIFPSQLEAE